MTEKLLIEGQWGKKRGNKKPGNTDSSSTVARSGAMALFIQSALDSGTHRPTSRFV